MALMDTGASMLMIRARDYFQLENEVDVAKQKINISGGQKEN